jgi:lysophospholipase L1-like esterase
MLIRGDVPMGLNPDNLLNSLNKISKWNALGDSITVNVNFTTKFYHEYIRESLGIGTFRNYGVGGSSYAIRSGKTDSFVERYPSMDNDADLITVFGGTNDQTVPTGTMADRTGATFYGACHVLYSGLIEKYPGKKIGIISPLPRVDDTKLATIVAVEKEVAAYYSIPFLNLYESSGINVKSTAIVNAFIPDGIHPNAGGHGIFAPKIIEFIKSL